MILDAKFYNEKRTSTQHNFNMVSSFHQCILSMLPRERAAAQGREQLSPLPWKEGAKKKVQAVAAHGREQLSLLPRREGAKKKVQVLKRYS